MTFDLTKYILDRVIIAGDCDCVVKYSSGNPDIFHLRRVNCRWVCTNSNTCGMYICSFVFFMEYLKRCILILVHMYVYDSN